MLTNKKLFTVPKDSEITKELIVDIIKLHAEMLLSEYQANMKEYMSDHAILHIKPKELNKPDNRLVANFSKYLVDTFGGFHMGIPVKVSHPDSDEVNAFIDEFNSRNDVEDTFYEFAKAMDIYGHAFLYLYQNEEGQTSLTYETPENMILVHDDTIEQSPLFAIRYQSGINDGYGTVILKGREIHFKLTSGRSVDITDEETKLYSVNNLPVIEGVLNEERQSIFHSVKTLIEAYNKAISEKANDVDYFADAYMKVIGYELDEQRHDYKLIRENRIINLFGDSQNMDVDFLQKPNADESQEHHIDRIERLIFTLSMVSNITDENFGNASGTALAFRLQPMANLARSKDRKMMSAFKRLYEAVFGVPNVTIPDDEWMNLNFTFTRNMPKNIKEEAEIVQLLDGQVRDSPSYPYCPS